MARARSVLDGHWSLDTFTTACACGAQVCMLRRGNMAVVQPSHVCPDAEHQRNVARTIRIEEQAGLRVTPGEAARRLREALS